MAESSRIEAYANAMLEVARVEGHLADVEDELFRFARTLDGSDELRTALSDRAARGPPRRRGPGAARGEGPADEHGARLVRGVLGRAGEFAEIVDGSSSSPPRAEASDRGSAQRNPARRAQIDRLRVALNRATDKDVEVKVIVDPSVMGGIVATIGDIVIDGSVRYRLEQLKEQI